MKLNSLGKHDGHVLEKENSLHSEPECRSDQKRYTRAEVKFTQFFIVCREI